MALLTNFFKKYLQNLKYNVKRTCTFLILLVYYPSHRSILSVKNKGGWGDLLNEQNLLSMMKVICGQSLYPVFGVRDRQSGELGGNKATRQVIKLPFREHQQKTLVDFDD